MQVRGSRESARRLWSKADLCFAAHRLRIQKEEKQMVWNMINEWRQKRTLRKMLTDPRSLRGFRSTGQLEKSIGADRATTERLLRSMGARKSEGIDEWTLDPSE
jgi:hypothetical protein